MQQIKSTSRSEFGLISTALAAEALGVSASTLKHWRNTNTVFIPYVKIGRLIKYDINELQRYVSSNTAVSNSLAKNLMAIQPQQGK